MRVLVTGATGFVGRWLVRELETAGHEPIPAPPSRELDVTDRPAMARFIADASPDAVAHLAGISHAQEARSDPKQALAVNEGGTRVILEGAAASGRPAVLVAGSSEVYGNPRPENLPLREDAPTNPEQPYGRSKLAQERAALQTASARDVPVVVTRAFNHTGPGQRLDFVVPALAHRLLQARRDGASTVDVGNLDVRRDLSDVRDVVRAYRLLIEGLVSSRVPAGTTVNVGAGTAVSIREIYDRLARIVGHAATPRPDPSLVRRDDPPLIVADIQRLRGLTAWSPEIPLDTTLSDLVGAMQ